MLLIVTNSCSVGVMSREIDECWCAVVFPRAATPTDLGGAAAVGMAGIGVGGLGVGGVGAGMYAFGRDESDGLDGGLRVGSTSQWSRPQSPSEFFSWSTGEYGT